MIKNKENLKKFKEQITYNNKYFKCFFYNFDYFLNKNTHKKFYIVDKDNNFYLSNDIFSIEKQIYFAISSNNTQLPFYKIDLKKIKNQPDDVQDLLEIITKNTFFGRPRKFFVYENKRYNIEFETKTLQLD